MVLLLSICCLHCSVVFDEYHRKPFIGTCTHSVCAQCFAKLQNPSCPVCMKEDAFKEEVINYGALAIMNDLAKKLCENGDYSLIEYNAEAYTEGLCIKCKEYSKKLRLCADCNPECFEEDEHGRMEQNVRTLRKFVIAKHVSVCAGCASDHHDGHRIELLKAEEDMFRQTTRSAFRDLTVGFLPDPQVSWLPIMVFVFKKKALDMRSRIRPGNRKFERPLDYTESMRCLVQEAEIKWVRLYDRKLLYLEAEIKEFVEHINQLLSNEQDANEKANLEKMIRDLEEILTAIPENLLTKMSAEEVAELDAELEQKMTKLEAKVIAEYKALTDSCYESLEKSSSGMQEDVASMEEKVKRWRDELLAKILGEHDEKVERDDEEDRGKLEMQEELEAGVVAEHKVRIDGIYDSQEPSSSGKQEDVRSIEQEVKRWLDELLDKVHEEHVDKGEDDDLVKGLQKMKLAEPKEDQPNNKPSFYLIDHYDLALQAFAARKHEAEWMAEGVEIMARSPRYPKYVVIIRERTEAVEKWAECDREYNLMIEQFKNQERNGKSMSERLETTKGILNEMREAIGEEIYAEELEKLDQEKRTWSQIQLDLFHDCLRTQHSCLEVQQVYLMTEVWKYKYFPHKPTRTFEYGMFYTMLLRSFRDYITIDQPNF